MDVLDMYVHSGSEHRQLITTLIHFYVVEKMWKMAAFARELTHIIKFLFKQLQSSFTEWISLDHRWFKLAGDSSFWCDKLYMKNEIVFVFRLFKTENFMNVSICLVQYKDMCKQIFMILIICYLCLVNISHNLDSHVF